MSLSIITVGRATLAKAVKDKTLMLAVGSGSIGWTDAGSTPALTGSETGLVTPIAAVRPTVKDFVVQDVEGAIEASDGSKWSLSVTPTRYLYLSFVLGFTDGPGATLKEFGLYLDPVYAESVGPGLNYIPWADVTSPGNLLGLERIPPLERAGTRQTIQNIITF